MNFRLLLSALFLIAFSRELRAAAPPIELELVTERGVQITAPHEWLQLLSAIGIDRVRIRGSHAGDEPNVENRGSAQAANYRVVGVLTARDQLRLPGGTFSRADRVKLKDYFSRLGANGADAVTAPHGRFGLTEKEMAAVLADLSQPIDFETKGQSPRAAVDRLQTKLALKFDFDAEADRAIRSAAPIGDELRGVSSGTALAIMLRSGNLLFRPEEARGRPVGYRVAPLSAGMLAQRTLGKTSATDMQYWPIGWEPEQAPGAAAPSLMESLNAEIGGYTLEEALAAIKPRLKVPMFLDHAALKAHEIDPAKIQVKLARTRTSYKRLIDRILAQAHLGSEIRVDEDGRPFLWITR